MTWWRTGYSQPKDEWNDRTTIDRTNVLYGSGFVQTIGLEGNKKGEEEIGKSIKHNRGKRSAERTEDNGIT